MSVYFYLACDKCMKVTSDYWQSHTSSRPGEQIRDFLHLHTIGCYGSAIRVLSDVNPEDGWESRYEFQTRLDLLRAFYELRKKRYPHDASCWNHRTIEGFKYDPETDTEVKSSVSVYGRV